MRKNSPGDDTASIVTAAEKLVQAVTHDDNRSGGLISRATIRVADELRALLLHYRARRSARD
jgi:hypothetical protein